MRRLDAITLSLSALLLGGCADEPGMEAYRPDPQLKPQEVVQRQVEALADNSELGDNQGIERAYQFASPANRKAVGPLPRFSQLLRNPGYRPLLNNRAARYSEPVFEDGRAAVSVRVTSIAGRTVDYVFFLSRSDRAGCQGCWLTDAVQPGPDNLPDPSPRVSL